MPYKSIAQEAWAHTSEGEEALGGPDKVAEWDSTSKGMQLPRRVKKTKTDPHAHRKLIAHMLRTLPMGS